jgi:hypothetical protein
VPHIVEASNALLPRSTRSSIADGDLDLCNILNRVFSSRTLDSDQDVGREEVRLKGVLAIGLCICDFHRVGVTLLKHRSENHMQIMDLARQTVEDSGVDVEAFDRTIAPYADMQTTIPVEIWQ